MEEQTSRSIRDIRLLAESRIPFEKLAGFRKHHRIPDRDSTIHSRFLFELVQPDIDRELSETFTGLKRNFHFKRKEMDVDGPCDGAGVIQTPFFTYEISAQLDPGDPAVVIWRRVLNQIRDPKQTFHAGFQSTFGEAFRILEIHTPDNFHIEQIVDHLEEREFDRLALDYDRNVSWCEIRIGGTDAWIRIEENRIRLTSEKPIRPRDLLELFVEVQANFLAMLQFDTGPWLVDV